MQDKYQIFMWVKKIKIIWALEEGLLDNRTSYDDYLQKPTGNQKHG